MANYTHHEQIRDLKKLIADVTFLICTTEQAATASEIEQMLKKTAQRAQDRRLALVTAEKERVNGQSGQKRLEKTG